MAKRAVRSYLNEFLSDDRVLDLPKPVQQFVLKCFILPKRPKQSAHAYQKIWRPEGSPLMAISRQVQELLEEIAMTGRDSFIGAGGGEFAHILCMNDHPDWIRFLEDRANDWMARSRPTAS